MTESAMQTALSKPKRQGRPAQLAIKAVAWIILCIIAGPLLHDFTIWFWAALLTSGTAAVIVQHFVGWQRPEWKSTTNAEDFPVETDPAAQDLFCIDCGYDLRELTSDRCPECGWLIDRNILTRTRLPWVYRKELGQWRAYWRTVVFASRNVKQLSMEIVRPVDAPDAQRFATVTALIAATPIAAALVAAMLYQHGTAFLNPLENSPNRGILPAYADAIIPFAAGITCWPIAPLATLLCVWLITHATPLWLGGIESNSTRTNRSAALGYYICAPMAAIPLGLASFLIWIAMRVARLDDRLQLLAYLLAILAVGIIAFCLVLTWGNALRLLRRTIRPSGLRLLITVAAIPVTWAACAVFAFGVMPWVVGFAYLMFDSLRRN